jgi:hypothetical protein
MKIKCEASSVTGCGVPLGHETLRLPHFIDNQLTCEDEVVSLTRRLTLSLHEDSWYSFLLQAKSTPRL